MHVKLLLSVVALKTIEARKGLTRMAILFLSFLAWGMVVFFFILLVRISVKPLPAPPNLRCKERRAFSDWQVCGEAVDGADAVKEAKTACSRPDIDGLLNAAHGWRTGSPRNCKVWSGADAPLHSESFSSNHGAGSPCRHAWCYVEDGNQQGSLCDQGPSARRDLFLSELDRKRG